MDFCIEDGRGFVCFAYNNGKTIIMQTPNELVQACKRVMTTAAGSVLILD